MKWNQVGQWAAAILLAAAAVTAGPEPMEAGMNASEGKVIRLPVPADKGHLSLEEALARRRSVRSFSPQVVTPAELSQLLWAAQGRTGRGEGRTAPSAGGLYPLEIYALTAEGAYRYRPGRHDLVGVADLDLRSDLAGAALGQGCIREAPVVFVIAAVLSRTERKYGGRAERYVWMEAGHAGQNLLLQAVSLGLAGVPVGAFRDEEVGRLLGLPSGQEPLYLIPVGRPRF